MKSEQAAIAELRAALRASAEMERTRPAREVIEASVARLCHLAAMNCGGAADLRRFLQSILGPGGLVDSSLDVDNERALLDVIRWVMSGGNREVLAPLENYAGH